MTVTAIAPTRPRLWAALPFALPIGLSAFLLFSVEPLVGRLVLPVFGGTPAVWATTLCFFQVILLVGYLYGHLSVTRLGWLGPPLHLAIAGLALVALAVAPARVADLRMDTVTPVLDLVRILFIVIGLPAFVLTTTTPLVSGWFDAARLHGDRTGDGYWLYALSNAGSLLALLAYPLVIEPRLGLGAQRSIWMVGYTALVVSLAFAGSRALPALRRSLTANQSVRATSISRAGARPIDWRRRGRWLLLAAVPSGLLSAVTTFIATDLVSAPLLWVAPLALYLGSFIVAFSPRGGRLIRAAVLAAPAAITLLWVPYGSAGGWPVLLVLVMELAAFTVIAVALHGLLAQDRPSSNHLTEFYLVLSVGGALASAFVALVAPVVFPGVWELPILLIGALVGLALVVPAAPPVERGDRRIDLRPFFGGFRTRALPFLVAVLGVGLGLVVTDSLAAEAGLRWMLVGGLILSVGARPWFLAVSTAFVLALATFVLQPSVQFRERSFFGVTQVLGSPDGSLNLLMNGTTVHGSQSTDPARRQTPQSYYVRRGPVGDLFDIVKGRTGAQSAVAITGLGGGALAAYDTPGMSMTFYEIDPVVIQVASDQRFFTYLADAAVTPVVIEGDARLSLASAPPASYDMLLMDAFSSDSVPVHLLTVEAITDEVRTVVPGGLIVFHVSNRYYDLAPPIAAAVSSLGLTILEKSHTPGAVHEPGETPSRWLAASTDEATIAALRVEGWHDTPAADRPFTDDYADLLRYLRLGS